MKIRQCPQQCKVAIRRVVEPKSNRRAPLGTTLCPAKFRASRRDWSKAPKRQRSQTTPALRNQEHDRSKVAKSPRTGPRRRREQAALQTSEDGSCRLTLPTRNGKDDKHNKV